MGRVEKCLAFITALKRGWWHRSVLMSGLHRAVVLWLGKCCCRLAAATWLGLLQGAASSMSPALGDSHVFYKVAYCGAFFGW